MSKEEISALKRQIKEAHQLLIELNDRYNEMLTKKHEKEIDKKEERKPVLAFDIDFLEDTESSEYKEMSKFTRRNSLLTGLIIFLEIIGIIPFVIGVMLVYFFCLYTALKTKKIKRKYHDRLSLSGAKIKVSDKEEMDELYEKVCEARFNYHNLRKKLESEIEYLDSSESEDRRESVLQQYAAYIDYVKGIRAASMNADNKSETKIYQLR